MLYNPVDYIRTVTYIILPPTTRWIIYVPPSYSNYQQEMDAVYQVPISTINELNFEIKINDVIANQITSGNPINLEIGFYE